MNLQQHQQLKLIPQLASQQQQVLDGMEGAAQPTKRANMIRAQDDYLQQVSPPQGQESDGRDSAGGGSRQRMRAYAQHLIARRLLSGDHR